MKDNVEKMNGYDAETDEIKVEVERTEETDKADEQDGAADDKSEATKTQATFSENIANDLQHGLHSVLYKKITNVSISDVRIKEVFTRFIKDVECGDSFTVIDILNAAESIVKGGEPNENAGNLIYTYEHTPDANKSYGAKMLKNSLPGIYSLFALRNGVAIDLDTVGSSMPAAESKRCLILPPQKAEKFISASVRNGYNVTKSGEVLSSESIMLTRNNEIIASVDKNIISSSATASVNMGAEHFESFLAGYNVINSITLCNCISSNNLVRFGLGGDISSVCARALGFYSAMTYLKTIPVRYIFVPDDGASVAVSRPATADGDYLYLLKLRKDQNGLPDKGHFGQLFYYLTEKKRMGIIKDVLPVGENVNRVINRLCNEKLGYVSMAQVPENCFGVIVSVGRGESVNGIKLGYFKSI